MEDRINILGDFIESPTGYGAHSKGLTLALDRLNPDKVSYECVLPEGWDRVTSDQCRQMILRAGTREQRRAHNVCITTPVFMPLKASERPKSLWQYCVFEGNKIPAHWALLLARKDVTGVLVPSEHTRRAVLNTLPSLNEKVFVVPHGVDQSTYRMVPKEQNEWHKPVNPQNKFVFGFVGGWAQGIHDRKDLALALRAFCAEFKPNEPVTFVAKINMAYNQGLDVNKAIDDLGLPKERPQITVITQDTTEQQRCMIYNTFDVFCCPSRAEAFGLTFLEAMACGVPCIAGGYGGQTDFVNDTNGWVLDKYELVQSKDASMMYEGIHWAQYSQEQLQDLMRKAYEEKLALQHKKKEALLTATHYEWTASAERLIKVMFGGAQ